MRRPFAAAIVVALGTGLLAASCGGSSDGVAAGETTSASTTSASEPTIEDLYRAPGEDVAAVPGTSDSAVGSNRIKLDGPSSLARAFPTWNARSMFAHIRPVSAAPPRQ